MSGNTDSETPTTKLPTQGKPSSGWTTKPADTSIAKPTREPGWIHTIVTRWSEFVWRWLVRALVVVLGLMGFFWLFSDDTRTNDENIAALTNRTFDNIATTSMPQKGAQLPLVGRVFEGGTYNVAAPNSAVAACSFTVHFEQGVPVVTFIPRDGTEAEVRDADPTRLALQEACQ